MKVKAMPIQKGNGTSESSFSPPPQKKLKQACLPFQILKSPHSEPLSIQSQKKRKLSDCTDEIKLSKVICSDDKKLLEKENKANLVTGVKQNHDKDIICISDSEDSLDAVSSQGRECSFKKQKTDTIDIKPINNTVKSIPKNSVLNFIDKSLPKSKKENCNKKEAKAQHVLEDTPQVEKSCPPAADLLSIEKEPEPEHSTCNGDISRTDSSDIEQEIDSEKSLNKSQTISNVAEAESLNVPKKSAGEAEIISGSPEKSPDIPEKTPDKGNTRVQKAKLTPKQRQRMAESEKRKEEKERLRLEKEKKKREEIEERLKQKEERLQQKRKEREEKEEQRKKEKEEKEEQRRKEKEEKEAKKQLEIELKNEEKKQKEDEKRKKEEARLAEKKRKEEERTVEEERKKKEAAAFTSFFVLKKPEPKPTEEKICAFHPFRVKYDMKLAPLCRVSLSERARQILDDNLTSQISSNLYLEELKTGTRTARRGKATWPVSDLRDEVVIIDGDDDAQGVSVGTNCLYGQNSNINMPRAKLLQFHENRRPPYWGTWRKKSKCIGPRRPFGKEEALFDYEVDSDDEWEEEEPGESLHGSDDEKESEDDYEVDDFLVPHGYLSEEENDDDESLSPETMKERLKLLEAEFQQEMKIKPAEKFKPRCIGCIWNHPNDSDPENPVGGPQIMQLLGLWRAVYKSGAVVTSDPEEDSSKNPEQDSANGSPQSRSKKLAFPDSDVSDLIQLVHGNINSRAFLVKEFSAFWAKKNNISEDDKTEENGTKEKDNPPNGTFSSSITKRSISVKIKEIASWIQCPEEGPMKGRSCWYVSADIRSQYGHTDLPIPNDRWTYICKPKKAAKNIFASAPPADQPLKGSPKLLPSITKFTKKVTREELLQQMQNKSVSPNVRKKVLTTKVLGGKKPSSILVKRSPKVHGDISSFVKRHFANKSEAEIITVESQPSDDKEASVIATKRVPSNQECSVVTTNKNLSEHKEATVIAIKRLPSNREEVSVIATKPLSSDNKEASVIAIKRLPSNREEVSVIATKPLPSDHKEASVIAIKRLPSNNKEVSTIAAKPLPSNHKEASVIATKRLPSNHKEVSLIAAKQMASNHKEVSVIPTRKKPRADLSRFIKPKNVTQNNDTIPKVSNSESEQVECIVID